MTSPCGDGQTGPGAGSFSPATCPGCPGPCPGRSPRTRWFAELTNRKLRRSAHRSVTGLAADIRRWINEWNKEPRPFVWTKSSDDVLETLADYCQRITLDA